MLLTPAILLLIAASLSSCGTKSAPEEPEAHAVVSATTPSNPADDSGDKDRRIIEVPADAQKTMDVKVAPAQVREVDLTVQTTGEVLANANLLAHVTAPIVGRVTEVSASVGQHVREGQALVSLRSQDIGQAEADLLQNEAQVRADLKRDLLQVDWDIKVSEAHLKLTESAFKRISGLADEKIASRADFEAARAHFEEDKVSLEALKRKRESTIALSQERMKLLTEPIKQKLRLLNVSDAEIDRILRAGQINPLVTVVAPETGIISERHINVGELVDPSKQLFTVANYRSIWLKADIYEKDIAKVREGQPIVLELDSFPGEKFHGVLDYVADSVNEDTRTLPVRAEVPNIGLKLKPKMFARMIIMVGEHQVLTIPKSAVQDAGSYKVVYIPAGQGRFEERRVTLGGESGDLLEVKDGLQPGDRVVTCGTFELRSESLKAAD